MHPTLTPMIERNAYIGGCDSVSAVKGAELIGELPTGTIPHALILMMGDTVEALKAFDEVIPKDVKRVALIDTLGDEKFEAIRAAEALGDRLFGVRLDTPGTRRGDFLGLLKEVRWELDIRGFEKVKILVSGGLDEKEIEQLNPVADGYGVGAALSNAPVINFGMDIVEIDGKPMAKRGKRSGEKRLLQCKKCGRRIETFRGSKHETRTPPLQGAGRSTKHEECGGEWEDLLRPLIQGGEIQVDLPKPNEIRERVLEGLRNF